MDGTQRVWEHTIQILGWLCPNVFREAAKAIQTFLSATHGQMHEHYEQKLRYYDTEWLRFASACQRMEDFCQWKLQRQQDSQGSHIFKFLQ